ncbi:hypothetical protein O9993_04375 [Vibrio lentus]|nr:hypothetical protein [Vibrio lentus]
MTMLVYITLLERYLSKQGFQVRSVANSEQMDRLLTREKFSLDGIGFNVTGRRRSIDLCRRLKRKQLANNPDADGKG